MNTHLYFSKCRFVEIEHFSSSRLMLIMAMSGKVFQANMLFFPKIGEYTNPRQALAWFRRLRFQVRQRITLIHSLEMPSLLTPRLIWFQGAWLVRFSLKTTVEVKMHMARKGSWLIHIIANLSFHHLHFSLKPEIFPPILTWFFILVLNKQVSVAANVLCKEESCQVVEITHLNFSFPTLCIWSTGLL